jgi:hypothetical protein
MCRNVLNYLRRDKRAMKPLITSLICSTLVLASQLGLTSPPVQDADAQMVVSCKFLGVVTGVSHMGGFGAESGIEKAKTKAREQATELGATHIVWFSIVGSYSPSAAGNAYKCGAV